MKILFALFLASAVPGAAFANSNCVPQAEMQEITRTFTQYAHLAKGDYCFDGSAEAHLIAGLVFMRKTQFAPMERSSDDLFSGRFASSWWNYFIGRINEFQIDRNCQKGVIAYVFAFGGRTMYACSAALTSQFSALDLASVFMHEARHIDGFPHRTCSHGPRQGLQGACDTRISDGGSYAVTVETYAQLARYATDVHPALKAYSRSASVVYADEAFEQPVRVERSSRFLVLTKDRRITAVNGTRSFESLGSAPELGHVVMRSQHMVLIPENRNSKARFLFARGEGEIATSPGNFADDYNALPPAERANLVDVHSGAQWNARVSRDKVRFECDPRSPTAQELALGETPVGILYPEGYDRAARSAQLMMESGKAYDFGCNGKRAFLQPSKSSYDQVYKSLYKVDGLTLGLTANGSLRELTGGGSQPFLPGLDGRIQEIMPNQVVSFFEEN